LVGALDFERRYAAGMESFRRPLGVLIAAALAWLIATLLLTGANVSDPWITAVGLFGASGFFVGLGAVVLIVWRLIRKPTA
jgi:hypothetical protein